MLGRSVGGDALPAKRQTSRKAAGHKSAWESHACEGAIVPQNPCGNMSNNKSAFQHWQYYRCGRRFSRPLDGWISALGIQAERFALRRGQDKAVKRNAPLGPTSGSDGKRQHSVKQGASYRLSNVETTWIVSRQKHCSTKVHWAGFSAWSPWETWLPRMDSNHE